MAEKACHVLTCTTQVGLTQVLAGMGTNLRVTFLLIAAALASSCTNDVLDASYQTTSAAVADGAVKRGWIPEWIPATATDLREVHDLDTNQSALTFISPQATWRPPASCRPASGGELSEPAFRRSWIPPAKDLAAKYEFFSCPSALSGPMLEAVAVQRGGKHVVHWRVLAR